MHSQQYLWTHGESDSWYAVFLSFSFDFIVLIYLFFLHRTWVPERKGYHGINYDSSSSIYASHYARRYEFSLSFPSFVLPSFLLSFLRSFPSLVFLSPLAAFPRFAFRFAFLLYFLILFIIQVLLSNSEDFLNPVIKLWKVIWIPHSVGTLFTLRFILYFNVVICINRRGKGSIKMNGMKMNMTIEEIQRTCLQESGKAPWQHSSPVTFSTDSEAPVRSAFFLSLCLGGSIDSSLFFLENEDK